VQTFARSIPRPTDSLLYVHRRKFATRAMTTLPSWEHK